MSRKDLRALSHLFTIKEFILIGLLLFLANYIFFYMSYYFLPLSIILHVNVFIRLFSLGHEGIHGLLHPSRILNDWVARYACHAPILFSFNKYRFLHLLHHKYTGSELDPDYPIDLNTPTNFKQYLRFILKRVIILQHVYTAIKFYTDLLNPIKANPELNYRKDSFGLVLFWCIIIFASGVWDLFRGGVVLWLCSLFFFPLVVELFSLMQHRCKSKKNRVFTRNIYSGFWLGSLVFPTGVGLHGIHHEDVTIPWYNLDKLKRKNEHHVDDKLCSTLKEIFNK